MLVRDPRRAFGSLACGADGKSVVVESAANSGPNDSARAYGSLWRVGLDGSTACLDSPPRGYSDDSPRVARDGTILFIRSRNGVGTVFALRGGRVLGPLLPAGSDGGAYYGHLPWTSVSWSRG
ncbi:MAG: hypothetical protein ACYDCH_11485 [Gaiellaceae bacterium]